MSGPVMAGTALAALLVLFAGVFFYARRIENYGVVDVAWSCAFGAMAAFFALAANGWWVRRVLILGIVAAWSLRLGSHLWRRVHAQHPEEDARYTEMRERWRAGFGRKMFAFFQLQAVSVVVLGLPFLFAVSNTAAALYPVEIAGLALWLAAWIGETMADRQLSGFKRDPANSGRVCAVGLWRYSRHPNYFFEWLVWVGFFLVGLAAPWGWVGVIAPAIILHLLLNVTGIPPAEAQSIRSKGDAYRRYQSTTNAFFPWFPRSAADGPDV